MGPFAWDKMVLIFIVVLVLFGPKELPKVAKTIAKFMNDFRRASSELKETWQRELSALEQETQDIRKELDIPTDLTTTSTGYSESSYHHDSSYDYGAYGYPDSTSEATAAASVAAAGAVTEPATDAATDAAVEGPAVESAAQASAVEAAPEAGSEPAPAEAAPVIVAAEGTVATHVAPPATDSHDEPAAS